MYLIRWCLHAHACILPYRWLLVSISAPSPPTKNTSQEQGRNKTTVPPSPHIQKSQKSKFYLHMVFGQYLWIFVHQNGNGNAFTSLRAAYEDTNSNATSCLIISQHFHNQRAVFYGSPDGSGRRSPTTQRIHRTYGGAPAISCASASRAPKRYTTSPVSYPEIGLLIKRIERVKF